MQTRLRTPFADVLDLPPPFTPVTLRESGDAFVHAMRIAPEAGAGTLVHVGRFDLAEFAVVLEPDEPLRTARRAFYAGMVALHSALAVHSPPEKPVTIDWPGTVRVDGGLVGGARFGWPQGADEGEPAPWLVFGAMIRTVAMSDREPGLHPLGATLEDEGFQDLGAGRLAESFARHLMVTVDAWQEHGFAAVAKEYLPQLSPEPGVRREIDETGDLVVRRMGKVEPQRRALIAALAEASWFDPASGGPRL